MGIRLIEEGAFCGLSHIQQLKLCCNKLITPPQICESECCVERLLLSENKIAAFGWNYFESFKKLNTLDVSNNKLREVPYLNPIHHSIRIVNMDGNLIDKLNVSLFRHMLKLSTFTISNNLLTYIDDFRPYYNKYISILGNPWHCGSELSWMGEEDNAFEKNMRCATPIRLKGKKISDMGKYRIGYKIQLPML